jgi:hypothetical protein
VGTRIVATPLDDVEELVHRMAVGPEGLLRQGLPDADLEPVVLDEVAHQPVPRLEAFAGTGAARPGVQRERPSLRGDHPRQTLVGFLPARRRV